MADLTPEDFPRWLGYGESPDATIRVWCKGSGHRTIDGRCAWCAQDVETDEDGMAVEHTTEDRA